MPGPLSPILEKNCSSKINPIQFYVSKKKKRKKEPSHEIWKFFVAIVNSNQLSQQVTSVDGAIHNSMFVQLFEWFFFQFIIIFD